MNSIEVVGLGALNMDHLYTVERILIDGETVVNDIVSAPGGSAANTIYGLARLGVKAGFSGVVGDDDEGQLLIQDFEKVGVDSSQIRVQPGARTGSVLCLSDTSGRRSLYVSAGANNLLEMDDLELSYINQAGMLHISSFVDDRQFRVLLEVIDRLSPHIKVSFSPGALYAAKGLEALAPILARTRVLFLNRNEIRQLTGRGYIAGTKICLEHGCQTVVTTLSKGAQIQGGITLRTPAQERIGICFIRDNENPQGYYVFTSSPATKPVIDTTGAGDAFAAGFLYGLLKNRKLDECGRLGDIVAQFSISKIGAREGLPTLPELSRRYRELYDREL